MLRVDLWPSLHLRTHVHTGAHTCTQVSMHLLTHMHPHTCEYTYARLFTKMNTRHSNEKESMTSVDKRNWKSSTTWVRMENSVIPTTSQPKTLVHLYRCCTHYEETLVGDQQEAAVAGFCTHCSTVQKENLVLASEPDLWRASSLSWVWGIEVPDRAVLMSTTHNHSGLHAFLTHSLRALSAPHTYVPVTPKYILK